MTRFAELACCVVGLRNRGQYNLYQARLNEYPPMSHAPTAVVLSQMHTACARVNEERGEPVLPTLPCASHTMILYHLHNMYASSLKYATTIGIPAARTDAMTLEPPPQISERTDSGTFPRTPKEASTSCVRATRRRWSGWAC